MTDTFNADLLNIVKSKKFEVMSFDCFDTLLLRRVPNPKDLFWILGQRLSNQRMFAFDVAPERFANWRIRAEEKARDAGASREVTLSEIYAHFPVGVFRVSTDAVLELEVSLESEFLFPSEIAIEHLIAAWKRGKKIVVVSDTYFSEKNLESFLRPYLKDIPVRYFVSSSARTGKYDRLFDVVLKKMNVSSDRMAHVGDNYHADIEAPASRGIFTCFLPHGSSLFWDIFNAEVPNHRYFDDRLLEEVGDLGITALRCKTILHVPKTQIDHSGFIQYGAQVLGPVLSLFAHWVHLSAIEEDVQLIVPLMREGYILEKLVSPYYENTGDQVRPAYLSRRLLIQANLLSISRQSLEALRFGNLESSVSEYLELIGLFVTDIPALRPLRNACIRENVTFHHVLDVVLNSAELLERIKAYASEVRKGVVSHVLSLITVQGKLATKIALVDVGWNGTIQRLLHNVLSEAGVNIEIVGYYMMTTPAVSELAFDGIRAKGFYIDNGFPESEYASLSRTLEIFEQSCSPSHGSVLRHDISTGEPVLQADVIPLEQRADIQDIQEGILLFDELYRKHLATGINVNILRKAARLARPILRRAMISPLPSEARMFGAWVHDDNLASGRALPILGTESSRIFIRYKSLAQFMNTPMEEIYWPSGALALSDPDRSAKLSLAYSSNVSLLDVETRVDASCELAVDDGKHGESDEAFKVKNHQAYFQNVLGNSYIRFELPVSSGNVLRWTPAAIPFALRIDFLLVTFKEKGGRVSQVRICGDEGLADYATPVGMVSGIDGRWRGQGPGCAFFFYNLRKMGVSGDGVIVVEVACNVEFGMTALDPRDKSGFLVEESLNVHQDAALVDGYAVIEIFNNQKFKGKNVKEGAVFTSSSSFVSLSGWLVDTTLANHSGDHYLRLTNRFGESKFVRMESSTRADLVAHFKSDAVCNCGYSLNDFPMSSGRYQAAVLQVNGRAVLVSKNTFSIVVE